MSQSPLHRWQFDRALMASELPGPARLILFVLAALANWPGGLIPARFGPSLTTLAEKTGLSRRAVAAHLNDVERTSEQDGWVVRSRPTKESARSKKERTQYQLCIPASARSALELVQEVHSSSAGNALASAPDAPELVQEMHRASAPGAHSPSLSKPFQAAAKKQPAGSAPEQIVIKATGATPDEAAAVVRRVQNERNPRSLRGLLNRMATDGDLPDLLQEHRAAAHRAAVSAALDEARRGPACEHTIPGGRAPHPTTGEPLCPQCRVRARLKVVTG
ncbi:hypothetical protein GCM10009779_71860 [Polymorphospora rubra]|uniref:Helix-turn-helix domain-containing protein n=1 Tax=Polymorphospora rubra TaxID=338584 RepID=A0A810MXK5_9ACTN|nr:hypothetical protein Prubr_11460 [Polymorphospora rubra]